MAGERRWIILCEDGRHVTVGRHADPDDDELARASEQLRSLGIGGWLAVLEGRYYGRAKVSIMMVRELTPTAAPWDTAVRAFLALRKAQTAPERAA